MKLVERQRRSIERWGFRGGNQQNKEQEMLAQLKHYGILPLQFRVTSISNLLQELNEWECSLESNDAEENGGSDDEDEIAQGDPFAGEDVVLLTPRAQDRRT